MTQLVDPVEPVEDGRQVEIGVRIVGLDPDRLAKAVGGLVEPAQIDQRKPEIPVRLGVVRR